MANVMDGDVVEETVNLQVIRRPKGERPRFIIVHLQSGVMLPLLEVLGNGLSFPELVMSDKDRELLQRSRRYVANVLARREKERKDREKLKTKAKSDFDGNPIPEWITLRHTNSTSDGTF